MKIVIFGAGFIGHSFVMSALKKKWLVTVVDRKPCPSSLIGLVRWIQTDISLIANLVEILREVDVVVHLISTTVPGDLVDEADELQQNVTLILKLLKSCIIVKPLRVVFVSSSSVYGLQNVFPISESASTSPISSHGIQKLTIEKYLQLYNHQHGLDCKIVRLSNPYGPGQNLYGRQGLIAIAIGQILLNKKIVVRGDGFIKRDFIYIEDVCEALVLICETKSKDDIFNIGSGHSHSINDVLLKLEMLIGRPLDIENIENRSSDIPVSILDCSKAKMILGYEPKNSLIDGLVKTFKFHNFELQ